MSGRLIILPKKSYTPWNPQNVERVIRDERLHKERLEKEENERRHHENRNRIELMKERRRKKQRIDDDSNHDGGNDCSINGFDNQKGGSYEYSVPLSNGEEGTKNNNINNDNIILRHVNLFEAEEKEMIQSSILGNDIVKSSISKEKSVGVMPVFLTERPGSKTDSSKNRPFYEKSDILRKEVDDKMKCRLDPMSQFVTQGNIEVKTDKVSKVQDKQERSTKDQKKKHRKSYKSKLKQRKDKKHSKHPREKEKSTMDELRARKLQREQVESEREETLMIRKGTSRGVF